MRIKIPYLHSFFEFISHNELWGIPLDILAHLIVGAICAYILLKAKKSYQACLISILILALVKELHDQQIMTNTLQENIKDIVVTMIPPFLLIYFDQLKTKKSIRQAS